MNTSNVLTTFNANLYTFDVTIEQLILLEEALWQRQQIHASIADRLQHTNHEKAQRSAFKADDYEELAQMVTDLINSSQREVLINANISN